MRRRSLPKIERLFSDIGWARKTISVPWQTHNAELRRVMKFYVSVVRAQIYAGYSDFMMKHRRNGKCVMRSANICVSILSLRDSTTNPRE